MTYRSPVRIMAVLFTVAAAVTGFAPSATATSAPYQFTTPVFGLAAGSGNVLIADAGANALLIANRRGGVNWVATLPDELVSTDNAKTLAGCPDAPPELADICNLPDEIPAQAVSTSVAVGPDGAYYVTELKG